MKPTFYFPVSVFLLFTSAAFSQAPAEQWVARYDSGSTDQLYDMTVDAAGNVYVTGASVQVPFTADYLTIKYNSSGEKQWEKVYRGIAGSDDRAYAIAVDASGNVYITGGTGFDNSIVTVKYNSLGDSLWASSYVGPTSGHNWTYAKSIFADDSGYVYIAGTSEGSIGVHGLFQDYTTIKYTPGGVQLWVARYNGPGTDADVINSMKVDASGNVYVTGYAGGGSTGSGDSYNDITTIKYNSLGAVVWTRTYKGPGTSSDQANKLTLDDRGNVYVTGQMFNGITLDFDMVTIKYNAGGTEQWKKFFNGTGSGVDEGTDLAVDALHNVYVTGKSYYGPLNGFDIITVKYDSAGTELWAKNFDGTSTPHDEPEAITLDNDGNVYVFGTSVNTTTAEDFQLIKYNPSGTQLWEKKYTYLNAAGSEEFAMALFVDALNNVYAAGMSALDYAVVKYAQPTGVEKIAGYINAVVLYPNPAANYLSIQLQQTPATSTAFQLFDITGRMVLQQPLTATTNRVELNGVSKGMYLYHVLRQAQHDKQNLGAGKLLVE